MIYEIRHRTVYTYSEPVTICYNKAHLKPRELSRQHLDSFSIAVTPAPAFVSSRLDYFGNHVTYFTVQEAHNELSVAVESEIELQPFQPPPLKETVSWEVAREMIHSDLTPRGLEAVEFTFDSKFAPREQTLSEFAQASFPSGRPILDGVDDLNRRIRRTFKYNPLSTTVSTPVLEVLKRREGVCQDFAHLMIGALRSLGLSARYVSGYLLTAPPPGKEKLVGVDASHAWVSVYIPPHGWIDFDPTNGKIPSDEHITLATGRDYGDVSPLRGVILGGGTQSLQVAVDVSRIDQIA